MSTSKSTKRKKTEVHDWQLYESTHDIYTVFAREH